MSALDKASLTGTAIRYCKKVANFQTTHNENGLS